MTGTLYLGGGGSADDERAVWIDMLQDAPRVLYWPFALEGATLDGAPAWLAAGLSDLGVETAVTVWTGLGGHDPAELADFDLLFIGGGNTFTLLDQVRRHGFLEPVRRFVAAGGSLYGGSAGAILAGAEIGIAADADANDVGLTDLGGLGLLGSAVVHPHHTPDQHTIARDYARVSGHPVIAIPERGGVVVRDERFRSAGPQSCWVINAENIVEQPAGSRW